MFVPDLGEFAYGRGEAVLSKEDVLVAADGDAAVLLISCDPDDYSRNKLC